MSQRSQDQDPDFGLRSDELRLITVGPEWARRFAEERARISNALGPAALDIQHIGSTSIPGIVAKPILDIAVAIQDFESGVELVPRLLAIGYDYRGESGIPRRHYFTRGSPRTHHLHLLERHGPDWARHLRFRDRLLASPALAARYSRLKTEIAAACGGDRERYQRLKASWIAETERS